MTPLTEYIFAASGGLGDLLQRARQHAHSIEATRTDLLQQAKKDPANAVVGADLALERIAAILGADVQRIEQAAIDAHVIDGNGHTLVPPGMELETSEVGS